MKLDTSEKITQRCGLIVWVKNINDQKRLYQYGDVAYVSKKMRYVYLYVNKEQKNDLKNQLKKLNFVRKVTESQFENLDFNADYQKDLLHQLHEEALTRNILD